MSAVELLSQLLQIDTTNPPGNEGAAAELISERARSAGLESRIHSSPEGRVSVVARVQGPTDRSALVLLSHSDVVPAETDRWSRDPFGGATDDGFMWGRGALDMKSIAVMHLEAAIAASGEASREVIVVCVADEEAGGTHGAAWLLAEHPEAVGFGDGRPPPEVIGEGAFGLEGVIGVPIMPVVQGEKTAVWVELTATGDPGHGALPPARQAPVNLAAAVARVAGHGRPRVHPVMREQFRVLARGATGAKTGAFRALSSRGADAAARLLAPTLRARGAIGVLLSDTVTPTQLTAGYKHNVVPGEASAALDCRLLPDTDVDRFIAELQHAAGGDEVTVTVKGRHGGPVSPRAALYDAIEQTSRRFFPDAVVAPSLTAGITDVRYFRARGAIGYGWVPLVLTPELLATIHGHDERIPVAGFETAVAAMTDLVLSVCT